jgi:hypothetical protein
MEMDFPGFIPKIKYIVPCNGTHKDTFSFYNDIKCIKKHATLMPELWDLNTWAKMSGYLRHQKSK